MNTTPHMRILLTVTVATLLFWLSACNKKDVISTDPGIKLEFSNDSVIFDTVFTSIGSATHRLMVYNRSDSKVTISSVRLANGTGSDFRFNIDGESDVNVSDVEIAGGDSLFVFVRVTIDPTDVNNPFVVEDDLQFLTNGNNQSVKLVAWGQNANYILADTYTPGFPRYKIVADSLETVHWTAAKPYVIYGYAVINSYGELIIDAGAQIYFHDKSGLWAYSDGVLKVLGTIDEPVHFSGDRLEEEYKDLPGQWDRIWLMESKPGEDHEIRNAVIENAFIGIQAESFLRVATNKLILENVIIQNMNGIGLFSRVYNIIGGNMVVANCGAYCMALTGGGYYNFIQSTFANYWPYGVRKNPAVFINNFLLDTLENPVPFNMNFQLGNSIIYGYNDEEFGTEMVAGADSIYFLDHVLMKSELDVSNADYFESVIVNEDPKFMDHEINDYRIDTLSPAIGKGSVEISSQIPNDILGNPRDDSPDLGAYEFIPGQGEK